MRNSILYIIVCAIAVFSSCDRNVHSDEHGVVVVLEMPTDDKAEGIDIRVFNSNSILTYIYNFATIEDVNSTLLPLPAGEYTLVTTVSTADHFAITEQIGKTTIDDLLFTMKVPDSSPTHAHYGVTEVTSVNEVYTNATIKANRIFSELEITLTGLDDDIVKVEIIIHNTAKGFYPAIQRLTQEYSSVYLGELVPTDNSVQFPLFRLMPVVAMSVRSKADAEIKTVSEFIFHTKTETGEIVEVSVDASLPEMENGGSYTAKVDFEVFRPGVEINITDINGWDDGSENNGEILNPKQ